MPKIIDQRQVPDVLHPTPDIRGRRYKRTAEAAEYTGVPGSTLAKRRMRGEPPAYIKVGASVIYDVEVLDDWLAAGRRTSTSDQPQPRRGRAGADHACTRA